jgi:hypothetical protein
MNLKRLHSTSFDWQKWRCGGGFLSELGISCREECLIKEKEVLRKYAIGYLEGEHLYCRPKKGNIAVMFFKDEEEFWFHLRKKEFLTIFGEYYEA